jgi:hypothetical protein
MSVFKKYQGKRITPTDPNWDKGRWYVWKRCGKNAVIHRALRGAFTEEDALAAEKEIIQDAARHLDKRYSTKVARQFVKATKKKPKAVLNYVYILESGGYYKIGRTTGAVKRLQDIARTIIPFETQIVFLVKIDNAAECEAEMHREYKEHRVRGEWFELTEWEVAQLQRKILSFRERAIVFATRYWTTEEAIAPN